MCEARAEYSKEGRLKALVGSADHVGERQVRIGA